MKYIVLGSEIISRLFAVIIHPQLISTLWWTLCYCVTDKFDVQYHPSCIVIFSGYIENHHFTL